MKLISPINSACYCILGIAVIAAFSICLGLIWNEPTFESDQWPTEVFQPVISSRTADKNSFDLEKFLPDARVSPGAVFANVTIKELGQSGYTKKVRDVGTKEKEQILDEYSLPWKLDEHGTLIDPHDGAKWSDKVEFDHIISLELGGSNDIHNLFPQYYDGRWGARVKDQYEDWIHRELVAGRVGLRDAQKRISSNWIENMRHDMPDYQPPSEK